MLRTTLLASALTTAAPALAFQGSSLDEPVPRFSVDFDNTLALAGYSSAAQDTGADTLYPPAGLSFLAGPPSVAPLVLDLEQALAGYTPGPTSGMDVDAYSHGLDKRPFANPLSDLVEIRFSVDADAIGVPGGPPHSVHSESGVNDSSADLFLALDESNRPTGPSVSGFHTGSVDGNGAYSGTGNGAKGLGVPEDPATGVVKDDVDCVSIDSDAQATFHGRTWFSIDAADSVPLHLNPSQIQSVSGAAVLMGEAVTGGPAVITTYATPQQLGLSASDEVDALALYENGDLAYQPSQTPFDWHAKVNPSDLLLFSVAPGSPIVGTLDSIFGQPITAGDILTTPLAGSSSTAPGIFIAAEALGLFANRFPGGDTTPSDNLNALDFHGEETVLPSGDVVPFADCNRNGRGDEKDISSGRSSDYDFNMVPDECDNQGTLADGCPPHPMWQGCGVMPQTMRGCPNSQDLNVPTEGAILSALGSFDVNNQSSPLVIGDPTSGPFTLTASYLPGFVAAKAEVHMSMNIARSNVYLPGEPGLFIPSSCSISVLSIDPDILELQNVIQISGGILGAAGTPSGCLDILAGEQVTFQLVYTDPAASCFGGLNSTNPVIVQF